MSQSNSLNKPVFYSSVVIIFFVTLLGAVIPDRIELFFKGIQAWINTSASWMYILSVAVSLIFSTFIMLSKYGNIRLGPDHSVPDYKFGSWIAMLFSAGMGIGLLFFGVAEPVMHFLAPPVGDPQSIEAAREAMNITFFHWGLHAWGVYALFALCLAYFSYRHKLPLLPRSIVYPIFGKKIFGPLGHMIDTFAVVGTMFGVATSLGFGITQVNAGLAYLTGLPQTPTIQFILIALITLAATVSVVLGLDGGIKKLSNLNMSIAIGLLLMVIIAGPTTLILNSFVQNVGTYLSGIVSKTFNLYSYDPKEEWIGGWTLLYWGWWVSWSPFVGMFIARISRGRTIRQFMTGVLFIPAGFTFLWMTAFGNTAINAILNEGAADFAAAVSTDVPVALFKFFELMPMSSLLSVIGVVLVTTFFITSSDSGSLVIDTLTSGGAAEPPVWQRIFWAVSEGLVAAVLLYAGGLGSLQTATITSAFPLMILILVAAYCLFKELREDYALKEAVSDRSSSIQYSRADVGWKEHLRSLVHYPSLDEVKTFMNEDVGPAMKAMASELGNNKIKTKVTFGDDSAHFSVLKKDAVDFVYSVVLREYATPDYIPGETETFYRAEVFLSQGGQHYNIFGYTREQIIGDILSQYEQHLQFLHLTNSELSE
ncbi:MAG: BCCT family transporter [Bacteriovoracaceae bacterium]|nr:BCCT family transporter [Bacteriovoracaceae bacterium]